MVNYEELQNTKEGRMLRRACAILSHNKPHIKPSQWLMVLEDMVDHPEEDLIMTVGDTMAKLGLIKNNIETCPNVKVECTPAKCQTCPWYVHKDVKRS